MSISSLTVAARGGGGGIPASAIMLSDHLGFSGFDLMYGQAFLEGSGISAAGYQSTDADTRLYAQTGEQMTDMSILLNFKFNSLGGQLRLWGSGSSDGNVARSSGSSIDTLSMSGGGYFQNIDTSRFSVNQWYRVVHTIQQEGADVRSRVIMDGTTIIDATATGTLSHSNMYVEILGFNTTGYYENSSVREVALVRGALDEAFAQAWSAMPSDAYV